MNKILSNQQPLWFNSGIVSNNLKCFTADTSAILLNRINSLENILQDKINMARQNSECCLINSYALTNNNKNIQVLKIYHQDQV